MSERIIAAAIKVDRLVCFVEQPGRHHDVIFAMERAGFDGKYSADQQGFVTDAGRFVGRVVGRIIAEKAGQIIASVPGPDGVMFKREHSQLFSEDVW